MDKKSFYTRRAFFILAGVVLVAWGAYAILTRPARETPPPGQGLPGQPQQQAASGTDRERPLIYLYFSDKQSTFLMAEERVLHHVNDPVALGRMIVEALIKGPQGKLMRTIPEQTALIGLYISQDGTAIVDLTNEIKENHPGGSASEIMTIFSIVTSLVRNIPQVDRVKILIEGREVETLAGHMDLSASFKADMKLVR